MSEERCPKCGRAFRKDRSVPQNGYYFGVVVSMISEETGFGKEETHEILKAMFLEEVRIMEAKGRMQEVRFVKSTTGLSTVEFEQYLSDIRQWAATKLSLDIPEPNETVEDYPR